MSFERASDRLKTVFRAMVSRLGERLHALPRDEEGGSMVFGAITLFTLVVFTMLVYQVGMTSGNRMQLQNAADAAAYSGALVEANALESIAFANEGMAYVYYVELRYAVDAIVYGTLNEFFEHNKDVQTKRPDLLTPPMDYRITDPSPPTNPRAPDGIPMGGDGSEFKKRYQNALRHANQLIPKGKNWLKDLHDAERVIFASTPRLVARTVAQVARDNGAEYVALSGDVSDVFRIGARQGFTDGSEGGASQRVDDAMFMRYERRALGVDPGPRSLPDQWFNAAEGQRKSEYYQVRLCWNKSDWDHGTKPGYNIHLGGDYTPYVLPGPAGHSHRMHTHQYITNSYPPTIITGPPHDNPHVPPDAAQHQMANAELLPVELIDLPHHCAVRCPTCDAGDGGRRQDGYTQIRKTSSEFEQRQPNVPVSVTFTGGTPPRPIKARGPVFRSGVTVATWAPMPGLSTLLPESSFGMLAIASAQIGIRQTDGTVAVATSVTGDIVRFEDGSRIDLANDEAMRNLFYASEADRGMKLGARLVPVGRPLTWKNGAEAGLRDLVHGQRWLGPTGEAGTAPPSLSRIIEKLDVERSIGAFAH